MSRFDSLPASKPDAAFSLMEEFRNDSSPAKVDLSPGYYRDEFARPWVLPSVKMAKQALLNRSDNDHETLPLQGHPSLLSSAQKLVFDSTPDDSGTIASIQTIAGTGANHLGALLLAKACRPQTVWISNPSWINHHEIWTLADDCIQRQAYPYFHPERCSIDFAGMRDTLESKTVAGDVVVLHACAHNPTGIDLSKEQWKIIADICERKVLVPLFDMAYQGFATGDIDNDAWSIRHFFRKTSLELLVAQSFSKNFGLYGERVGALHVVCRTQAAQSKTLGLLTRLSRAEITTSPINGARIVAEILGDETLRAQWLADLQHMSDRIRSMRMALVKRLQTQQTPGSWDHILSDIGMFSMSGLTSFQIEQLREIHHVYLLPSGRMSMTGLTEGNVDAVAKAFHRTIVGDGSRA